MVLQDDMAAFLLHKARHLFELAFSDKALQLIAAKYILDNFPAIEPMLHTIIANN